MDDVVLLAQTGAIATITLNRPTVLNALNGALLDALAAMLAAVDADPAVRVVVLTGAGDRAFAAGADIAELAALPNAAAGAAFARRGQRVTRAIEGLRVPVIAAVNGFALGGGCELAMACDIRLAAERARFGQPEVNLGILPGFGGSQRALRLLGPGAALYLCTTGTPIDAAEALRIGLVQRVVPDAELLAQAHDLARTIAAKAPLAVTAAKRAIRDGAALAIDDALALEAVHFGSLVATEDFRTGTSAFLEKRPPTFDGR